MLNPFACLRTCSLSATTFREAPAPNHSSGSHSALSTVSPGLS